MDQGTSKLTSVCVQPAVPETNPAPLNIYDESVESQVINNEPDKKRNVYQSHNNPDNAISSDDEDVDCSSDAPAPIEQVTPAPTKQQTTPAPIEHQATP